MLEPGLSDFASTTLLKIVYTHGDCRTILIAKTSQSVSRPFIHGYGLYH